MSLGRLRASDVLAGLFGAALVGLLWAPWYRAFKPPPNSVHTSGGWTAYARIPGFVSFSGWQAFRVNDVIFLIAGLLGVWLVVATATHSTSAVPIAADVFAALVGMVASVLAVIRLIWPPDLGPGPTDRAVGVWLGAIAAIGMTVSALVSMSSERRGQGARPSVRTVPAPQA